MKRTVQMPRHQTRALTELTTVDKEGRTIEVVWTTGARGLRYGWEGQYYEELSLDPAHVRLDRLKAGAAVLDSHNRYDGLSKQIGVVDDAWIVGPTEARARIRFSDDPAKQGTINDILNGIIRNLSVGYSIHKLVEVGREGDVPVLRAEDWEPLEISYVTIPFDAKSQSRSGEGEPLNNCEVTTTQREIGMDPVEQARIEAERVAKEKENEHKRALEGERKGAVEEERKRVTEINLAVEKAGLERKFGDDLIAQGKSVESARELILDALHERNKQTATMPATAGALDEKKTTLRAISDTITLRYAPQFNKPSELTARYRSSTILDMCKDVIRMSGARPENYTKSEIAERALHTSSDFPNLLGDSLKKILSDNYNAQPADFSYLTQPQGMSDYKTLNHYGLSAGPSLLEVKEHGEYKRGTLAERAEALALKKYGRIIGVTREAIINDDLSAFARVPRLWSAAAANLQASLILGQITGNPVMSDGVTLFHASHGNLAATGTALDLTNLALAVAALESQTSPASTTESPEYLRLRARYLIVSPALKTAATQLTTSIDPITFATVNPFSYLEVKSDPSITGNAWYVAADKAQTDTIALMYLEGEQGPQLSERQGFDVDGIEYKVRLDTGAKILDHRWIYKNPGV